MGLFRRHRAKSRQAKKKGQKIPNFCGHHFCNPLSKRIGSGATEKKEAAPERNRKRRKRKRGKFEGHSVSHLVKSGAYERPKEEEEEAEDSREQDNYVLSKLFKRSGVHSALRHDVIVGAEDGAVNEDYELVEGEAERVAKEAVDSLREKKIHNGSIGVHIPILPFKTMTDTEKKRFAFSSLSERNF